MAQTFSDTQILQAVRSGKDDRELAYLYDAVQPKIVRMVCKQAGDVEEANDVFQDAMVIFYRYVKEGKFDEKHRIEAFLYTISRNLWINRAKRRNRNVELEPVVAFGGNEDLVEDGGALDGLVSQEREQAIDSLLSKLGERCKRLLTLSIFHHLSMKEICQEMGFATENAAKTRKYKCKQKLISMIKDNPALIDALTD